MVLAVPIWSPNRQDRLSSRMCPRRPQLDALANESPYRPTDFNIGNTDISGSSNGRQPRDLNEAYASHLDHKRASPSRRIDECPHPDDPYFIRSTCDYSSGSPNRKSYKLTCNYRSMGGLRYRIHNDDVIAGACTAEEFCVQNDHAQPGGAVAYCVSNSNIIDLIGAPLPPTGHRLRLPGRRAQPPRADGPSGD